MQSWLVSHLGCSNFCSGGTQWECSPVSDSFLPFNYFFYYYLFLPVRPRSYITLQEIATGPRGGRGSHSYLFLPKYSTSKALTPSSYHFTDCLLSIISYISNLCSLVRSFCSSPTLVVISLTVESLIFLPLWHFSTGQNIFFSQTKVFVLCFFLPLDV